MNQHAGLFFLFNHTAAPHPLQVSDVIHLVYGQVASRQASVRHCGFGELFGFMGVFNVLIELLNLVLVELSEDKRPGKVWRCEVSVSIFKGDDSRHALVDFVLIHPLVLRLQRLEVLC